MKNKLTIATVATMLIMLVSSASAISDNFSTDSGIWSYEGSAQRDASNESVILTNASSLSNWGQIWLNDLRQDPFIVRFRYRAGGGTGADGLVFMFYKNSDYSTEPDYGGSLGFSATPHESLTPVSGYGIEFDNYFNGGGYGDPSENHIALIKDHPGNHLKYANDIRTEDYQWHSVEVKVDESNIEVSIDGSQVLSWNGSINRTYGGIGFSAATGASTNWHIIDDIILKINVAIDIKPGSEPNSINNNGNGVIPVAILGSQYFDVTEIDADSIALEGMAIKAVGKSNKLIYHYRDVNRDAISDLVVHIENVGGTFSVGDTSATLTGNLLDGTPIEGQDSIRIVP